MNANLFTRFSLLSSGVLTSLLLFGCNEGLLKSGDCASNPDGDSGTVTAYYDADGDGHADERAEGETVCWNAIPDDMFVSCDKDNPAALDEEPCVEVDDCDDLNATAYPGAAEACDGVDNDCDGQVDQDLDTTWYEDADRDDFGNDDVVASSCDQPEGYVSAGGDCDDDDPETFPGATEVTDGVDNDCSGPLDDRDALPTMVDTDEITQLAVTGFASNSGLNRGCVLADSLERVFLGDDVIAVFTSDSTGAQNIGAAGTSWELDGDMDGGDRALRCMQSDLDSAGRYDVAVGARGAASVQLSFEEYPDLFSMFTDDDSSSFGASLADIGGFVVVGAPSGRGDVTVAYEAFDYGDDVPKGARTQLTISGDMGSAGFGSALDGANDLNGDDLPDLVVGGIGSVTVLDGAALLEGEEEKVLTVTGSGTFGQVLVTSPDLTGDGVPDIVVSAPDLGKAWIIPGQSYGSYAVDDIAWTQFHGDSGSAGALVALEAVGGGGPAIAIGDEVNDRVLLFRKEHLEYLARLALDETAASTVIEGTSGSAFGSYLFDALDADGDGVSELGVCARDDDDGRGACFVLATHK